MLSYCFGLWKTFLLVFSLNKSIQVFDGKINKTLKLESRRKLLTFVKKTDNFLALGSAKVKLEHRQWEVIWSVSTCFRPLCHGVLFIYTNWIGLIQMVFTIYKWSVSTWPLTHFIGTRWVGFDQDGNLQYIKLLFSSSIFIVFDCLINVI